MASANATKEKNIDLEKLDLDDLERQLEEDFGEDLDRELAERLAELDFVDEQKAQIANPDMLGQVVLNTVWDQFTNQVAIQAGEDFVKSNNGLRLDLSDDAHIIDPDKFEKGQLPEHNFENQAKYKKRLDETRADFQTDPNMQVKMSSNMRYNEETKTYERYDKTTDKWVGKTRYNEETKTWEDYNPRNGKWQKKLSKDARKNFDTRTKDEKGSKTVNKDHVISAAEQMRDNEAAAYMDRDTRQEFAKSDVNIQDLDSAANQSKSDLSTEEWLNETREDGQKQADYFGVDEEELRENDKKAREAYEKEKEKAKEKAVSEGRKSQKAEALRVGKKAARAIIMNLLAELVKKIIQKFVAWLKSSNKNLKSLLTSIKDAIIAFVIDLKTQVVSVLDTAVTVIASSIIGPVVGVIKKAWMFIKQGWKSLKEAVDYIRDPKNKGQSVEIMMMEVGKIVMAGLTAGGAIVLGEVIEAGLTTIPIFAIEIPLFGSLANIIGIFMGAVVAGIIGALAIDLINRLIAKKQKQMLEAERIDKANAVLATQDKIIARDIDKLNSEKEDISSSISNRHNEAGKIMKEALDNIVNNDGESNDEELRNIRKRLDSLVKEE